MLLYCEQKMVKHILFSLDVADQWCIYLQSTGVCEDLLSQGNLWLLISSSD